MWKKENKINTLMGRTMKGWWESMPRGGGDGWSGKRWRNCPTWLWLCPPLLQFYQLFFQDEDSDGSHNLHLWLVTCEPPPPIPTFNLHSPYPFNVEEPSAIPIPSRPHHNPAPHPTPTGPRPAPPPHTHAYSIHIIFSYLLPCLSVCYDIIQYLFTVNKHKMEITQQRNSRTGYYHGLIVFSVWFH